MKGIFTQLFSLVLPITVLILVPICIEPRISAVLRSERLVIGFRFVSGLVVILAGLFVMARTIAMFIRIGKGTLAPWSPTRTLVVSGLYAHVRNPMILGVMIVLIGEALVISSMAILIEAVFVFLINTAYFMVAEEPGLEKRFGAEYMEYKRNVPRWIPRWRPWRPG